MTFALALTGPTASGKTALSLSLAESFSGEIISCDSMQIYKGMDIGTAKATEEEQMRVPHYMLDLVTPPDSFSAETYREMAVPIAEDIAARGKLPIFVGGTGLYIDTVIRGSSPMSPPSDPAVRERLMREGESEEGREALYERLIEVDPESAAKTHRNNLRRVVRALEIFELTGITKSRFDELSHTDAPDIRIGMITLDFHNRKTLYDRIDRRVDIMLRDGLLDEVRSLYESGKIGGDNTPSQAIGYKELVRYLRGEISLDCAIDEIKQSSRRYAKRQLTWFRSKPCARLFVDTENGAVKDMDALREEAVGMAAQLIP